jgi:alpha-beta hydrolase superfamily lysophospholipase
MERRVHFYSGPGLRLAGILEVPDEGGVSGRRPGIVLCHAGTGTKEILMPEVSNWLVRKSYAVMRFDYRGFGESEGPECRLIPLEQVEDIRNAITCMQQQDEVDGDSIGLWGASSGGANVSYTAGVDTRVKCMVSVSGTGDMGRRMRESRRYWEWREFLKTLEEDRKDRILTGKSRRVVTSEISLPVPTSGMDTLPPTKSPGVQKNELSLESADAMISFLPETVVDRISPRAAMWIYTAEDTVVPIEESQSMYKKAHEPKKIVVIEGFRHYELYHGPGFECMMTNATEWFNTYLGA